MAKVEPIEPHLAPIQKSIVVRRAPAEAFEIFTGRIGKWWPLGKFSIHQADAIDVMIEKRVGGRIYEVARSGEQGHWGTVLAWEPPRRFVMSWHPGSDPATPTEVEVRFVAVPEGTRVELEHRDWTKLGVGASGTREQYEGGWATVFERCFLEACS